MAKVNDILLRVRANLSDADASRWTDERLINLIDEAQKDLANKSGNFRDIIVLDVIANESFYNLPDKVLTVSRVEYDNTPLKLYDFNKFDGDILETGTPQLVVIDKLRRQNIMLYPTPDKDLEAGLQVFCKVLPLTLDDKDDELEISPAYYKAIEYFVTYRALLDNQDTMSINLATNYNSLYNSELGRLIKDSMIDFKNTHNFTEYKGFI